MYWIVTAYLLTAQMYFPPSSCTIRKNPVLRSILILVGIVFSEKHISIIFILQYCIDWIDSSDSFMNLKFQVYEVLTKYYVILVMIYFSSAQTKKFKKYIWRANQLFDMRNLLTVWGLNDKKLKFLLLIRSKQ